MISRMKAVMGIATRAEESPQRSSDERADHRERAVDWV